MDSTYRFRFLIYLAAFMLVMSLCFVYAEPLPADNPLLFQIAPQHAGFLAPLRSEPSFDPAALRATVLVASPGILQQLNRKGHSHLSFVDRSGRSLDSAVQGGRQSRSSALGLAIQRPASSSSTR